MRHKHHSKRQYRIGGKFAKKKTLADTIIAAVVATLPKEVARRSLFTHDIPVPARRLFVEVSCLNNGRIFGTAASTSPADVAAIAAVGIKQAATDLRPGEVLELRVTVRETQ